MPLPYEPHLERRSQQRLVGTRVTRSLWLLPGQIAEVPGERVSLEQRPWQEGTTAWAACGVGSMWSTSPRAFRPDGMWYSLREPGSLSLGFGHARLWCCLLEQKVWEGKNEEFERPMMCSLGRVNQAVSGVCWAAVPGYIAWKAMGWLRSPWPTWTLGHTQVYQEELATKPREESVSQRQGKLGVLQAAQTVGKMR